MSELATPIAYPRPPWSVIDGSRTHVAEAFAEILRFYVPPPALVLDPTSGKRIMYKRLEDKTLDGLDYEFIFGDIKSQLTPSPHVRLDAAKLPFRDDTFDAVVFDLPYQEDWQKHGGEWDDPRQDDYAYTGWTKEDIYSLLVYANREFARALKTSGRLILKIQDQWVDGVFYPHSDRAIALLWNFRLYDKVLYRYYSWTAAVQRARYKYRRHAFITHSYHLVFTKLGGSAS
jgi:SAM-dependent methyltransferase